MRQRKRHPLDVPTPVAVALADFCRRAGATVEPRTVRDALSLLEPSQDEQVLRVAGAAPQAKPLGPFAVVEIVEGEDAEVAARRQRDGAYDSLALSEAPGSPPPPSAPRASPVPEGGAPEAPAPRSRRAAKPTMAARIAPKRRKAGEPPPPPRPPAAPKPPRYSIFHKKDLPKGRGRFTRVDLTKLKVHKLLEPQMKEELEALIEQHGHRVAIKRALEPLYFGKKGEALQVADIEGALLHHELRALIAERERQLVIAAVTEAKGDLGRAAATLGMRTEELDHVALNCGAAAEIAKVREHHAREALAHGNLRLKLDLLERPKYLADLGVEKRFRDALALELTELIDKVPLAASYDELLHEMARREALPYEKLKAAVDRTGVSKHAHLRIRM